MVVMGKAEGGWEGMRGGYGVGWVGLEVVSFKCSVKLAVQEEVACNWGIIATCPSQLVSISPSPRSMHPDRVHLQPLTHPVIVVVVVEVVY